MMTSQVYAYVPSKDDDESPFADDTAIVEGLISRPDVSSLPIVSGKPMMQITAPATLPEGYELPVQLGSLHFNVKVPMGGIEQGQVFSVPIPQQSVVQPVFAPSSIPVGDWRDSECDCFNYGVCHPHIWTSLLCTLLAAGQVINRLQFTWTGIPARNAAESARAFAILFYITVGHWIMVAVVEISVKLLLPQPGESDVYVPIDELPKPKGLLLVIIIIYNVLRWAYFVMLVVVLIKLRRSIRGKFGIPGSSFEDCCCSFWCSCLVVGQMLRHTTDYEVYPSQLCSVTGLSSKVGPMLV